MIGQVFDELSIIFVACVMQEGVSSKIYRRIYVDLITVQRDEGDKLLCLLGDCQIDHFLLNVDELVGREDHGSGRASHLIMFIFINGIKIWE